VVQVGVAGGDDEFVVSVLQVCQLVADAAGMVVVDEGYRAYTSRIRR